MHAQRSVYPQTHSRTPQAHRQTDTNIHTHKGQIGEEKCVSSPLEATAGLTTRERSSDHQLREGREMAETNAEERSLEEARDRVGDTRQEEEERWLKMAARDQPQISQQRNGGVCWSGRALVGGEVERELLFLLVVLRGCRPPSRAPVHTHSSSFPCPCRCHRHSQLPCPCQDGLLRVVYVVPCRRSVSHRIEDMGLN